MAYLTTLARPYAKAAFQYASAAQDLAKWSDMIALLAAVAGVDKVQRVLGSPSISATDKAGTIIVICGDSLDDNGKNLVKILAQNNRLGLLPEISLLFETFRADAEKRVDVEITSAVSIDKAIEEQLTKALKTKLDCDVRTRIAVDESLIGGVVIRAGDTVIDSSIRGRLAKLAEIIQS